VKKTAAKPKPAAKPGPAPKPAAKPAGFNPGGVMQGAPARPAPKRAPAPKVIPGGVIRPVPARKTAARKKPVKRKWTPDGDVALCSARAVAESLRIALGRPVSDEDVLTLYWHTADSPDAGASILATLEAASEFGLAGVRLAGVGAWRRLVLKPQPDSGPPDGVPLPGEGLACLCQHVKGLALVPGCGLPPACQASIVLGVELPGSHAVTLGPDGAWWSWGEPHDPADFPGAVVEEAWEVTW